MGEWEREERKKRGHSLGLSEAEVKEHREHVLCGPKKILL